jgi:hypothetical protein
MKLRLLNSAHSELAYLGYLAGYETIADVVADDIFRTYVGRLWDEIINVTHIDRAASVVSAADVSDPPGDGEMASASMEIGLFRASRSRMVDNSRSGSFCEPSIAICQVRCRIEVAEPRKQLGSVALQIRARRGRHDGVSRQRCAYALLLEKGARASAAVSAG